MRSLIAMSPYYRISTYDGITDFVENRYLFSMDYSLRELECFTAAAEELSFTRAARRLHLAQPPLSRHIRALEEKIGTRLFERTRRTVVLTAAGSLFYEESRGILAQLVRAGEMAKRSG